MSSSAPQLPDPRQYSVSMPNNMLLHDVEATLKAVSADDRQMWLSNVKATVTNYLERDEVLPLSVALAMVPSQAAYRTLWQALCEVVDGAGEAETETLFALPIVLVVGAKSSAVLPGVLPDVSGLMDILVQHKVVLDPSRVTLSSKLLHPDSVSGLSSGTLYRLNRAEGALQAEEIEALPEAPLSVSGEGVFLRYLVGSMRHAPGQAAPIVLGGAVSSWGIPVMDWLGNAFKAEGVTLFPIARPPQPWLSALVAGGRARQEVAMQVFASNRLRKLRELSLDPVAIASSHQCGELRFTLSAAGDDRNWEGFVWPLSALDSVPLIAEQFASLMADCHVRAEDVRFVPAVQPDNQGDVPLFFTANELPLGAQHIQ